MASFMSGMAGNVTAFNTVWTYDIYQSYFRRNAPDSHYLTVGRVTTVIGILLSIATAYVAQLYNNIMDLLQLVFGFVNAPLFATFLLGMFWRRTTGHGAFAGLVSGTAAAALTHGLTIAENKGGWLGALAHFPSTMAQNFWIAIWAWSACFVVTIAVSLITTPKQEAELRNLVYGLTEFPRDEGAAWYHRPGSLAIVVAIVLVALNVAFW
jgi:SSS family solute:Na+ symporter